MVPSAQMPPDNAVAGSAYQSEPVVSAGYGVRHGVAAARKPAVHLRSAPAEFCRTRPDSIAPARPRNHHRSAAVVSAVTAIMQVLPAMLAEPDRCCVNVAGSADAEASADAAVPAIRGFAAIRPDPAADVPESAG